PSPSKEKMGSPAPGPVPEESLHLYSMRFCLNTQRHGWFCLRILLIWCHLIVCDYLDEAYPKKRLTPSDPLQEAKQRIILELSSGVVSEQYKVLMAKKSNEGATALHPEFASPRNFYFINLSKWYEHMLQDTAAKQTLIEPEVMLGFFKLYSQDSTEVVDYGL
uniref:Uncharacterized protein n=1 Tax=Leptobrachium leishanense TaxID=445787 RepID=A0A8C5P940_9ANUR